MISVRRSAAVDQAPATKNAQTSPSASRESPIVSAHWIWVIWSIRLMLTQLSVAIALPLRICAWESSGGFEDSSRWTLHHTVAAHCAAAVRSLVWKHQKPLNLVEDSIFLLSHSSLTYHYVAFILHHLSTVPR